MENNWICVKEDIGSASPLFFKHFVITKPSKAILRITALGLYKAYLNGKLVSPRILTPGLTSYPERIQYQEYDVTAFLKKGENVLEVLTAPGWAIGHYGLADLHGWMGDKVLLNLSLDIEGKELFHSDSSFKARESFITFSDIYNGEHQDYSKESFNDLHVEEVHKQLNLVLDEGEEVLEREEVKPCSILVSPKGETIIDFGQNLAGYLCLLNPKEGKYAFSFAEVLDKDGNFYNENYRASKNDVVFVIGKKKVNEAKPFFSFQGFRYVKVLECPKDSLTLENIKAIVVYSNIKRLSFFKCSNKKINQLYSNVIWGQKGNFIDVPTDCPQRDERLGWTGDAEVFARTACYNFDCARFYSKWLKDVALTVTKEGGVLGFVPHPFENMDISAAWGDVCSIIPFEVFDATGDTKILKDNLQVMEGWVEYMHRFGPAEYLWLTHFSFGDWLALDLPAGNYVGATQKDFISSAYFYKTTKQVGEIKKILGEDSSYFDNLANKIKKAFRDYFLEDGLPKINYQYSKPDEHKPDLPITQTSLSILLSFGLYEGEGERKKIAATLDKLVEDNGNRLNTGFVGTPLLLSALSENGYQKRAIEVLLQERFPSWLYSINNGATTIWEHWDGVNEKGEFWSKDMNSFNHYAYGAVLTWIIENIVGLKRLKPAYKEIAIRPIFDERFGDIDFKINTPNGEIHINHTLEKGEYVTRVETDKRIKVVS